MKRIIGWIVFLCLLAGGAVVCAIRWEAWFGNPPEPKWNASIIEHEFVTFNNDSVLREIKGDTLSFLILGDIHNSLTNSQMSILSERHKDISWWGQLGDWMERPYVYYEQMMYQSLSDTRLGNLPIIAIPGNHEYLKGVVKTLPARWKNIFPNPKNGPTRFVGTTYFVDFPQMRVIAIDTDGLHRLSDYTQLSFWLRNTLRDAGDRFKVVMMHHPIYSTAEGRSNPLLWMALNEVMRDADVVFSGHDHNYARCAKKYKAYLQRAKDTTVFISTNASNKEYNVKQKSEFDCTFSGEAVYEYVVVVPDSMHIYTYNLNTMNIIDQVSIAK